VVGNSGGVKSKSDSAEELDAEDETERKEEIDDIRDRGDEGLGDEQGEEVFDAEDTARVQEVVGEGDDSGVGTEQ